MKIRSMSIQKKVVIVCEKFYEETIWCKQILGGLLKELKKRRISCEQRESAAEAEPEEQVCILGVTGEWLQEMIRQCNGSGSMPIVLSSRNLSFSGICYHGICPDLRNTAELLQQELYRAGRKKIALYGANHMSDMDAERTELFSRYLKSGDDVFHNTGNLENCFRMFLPKAAAYDAVLCINGYTAISLVKKLHKEAPELLEKLVILSLEEVLRHSKYNQWIHLADLNLEAYGAAALAVMDMSSQVRETAEVTLRVKGSVCEIPVKEQWSETVQTEDAFQGLDPELLSMAKMEQLLRDADDMDHHIIALLLDGATYSEIADSSYMTEGNVKYRVKKYMTICDCKTKKELLELLQEYLR